MDRLLRRELDAIARDRRSGAAELALRAVTALQAWVRLHPKPTERQLLEIAHTLLRTQPAMAPFGRLANELLLAMRKPASSKTLQFVLARSSTLLETAGGRIAARFVNFLHPGLHYSLGTYSYSSTVLKAIAAARKQIPWVLCSEGRPEQEGRRMAAGIARLGIEVRFVTDASLPAYLPFCSLFVVGADAVASHDFKNKVGTRALVTRALEKKKPICVLADTMKFWPRAVSRVGRWAWFGPNLKIWAQPPKGVTVIEIPFEWTSLSRGVRILTERGWFTPTGVRRAVEKILVAPELKQWLLQSFTIDAPPRNLQLRF